MTPGTRNPGTPGFDAHKLHPATKQTLMKTQTATSALIATTTMISTATARAPYFAAGSSYAEQKRELEAIGGDPSFLEPPAEWDGSIDESAHFGGWEGEGDEEEQAPTKPKTVGGSGSANYYNSLPTTEEEIKREVEAVGGDVTFLHDEGENGATWNGMIDESAHFGGWEERL